MPTHCRLNRPDNPRQPFIRHSGKAANTAAWDHPLLVIVPVHQREGRPYSAHCCRKGNCSGGHRRDRAQPPRLLANAARRRRRRPKETRQSRPAGGRVSPSTPRPTAAPSGDHRGLRPPLGSGRRQTAVAAATAPILPVRSDNVARFDVFSGRPLSARSIAEQLTRLALRPQPDIAGQPLVLRVLGELGVILAGERPTGAPMTPVTVGRSSSDEGRGASFDRMAGGCRHPHPPFPRFYGSH